MHGATGSPVARFQATRVSLWLEIPSAATSCPASCAKQPSRARRAASKTASADCSTQPLFGKWIARGTELRASTLACRSTKIALTLVVPASSARMTFMKVRLLFQTTSQNQGEEIAFLHFFGGFVGARQPE